MQQSTELTLYARSNRETTTNEWVGAARRRIGQWFVCVIGLPVVICLLTLFAEPIMAQDQSGRMLTSEALPLAQSGEIVLIDIRTPEEWSQTGVAEPAHTNSMHVPGFLERLDEILDGNKSSRIALICATGGRSSYLQSELRKRGYQNVIDVTDGMIGSGAGPGWLGNGYSTRKIE